jgi:hypothetical protein
MHVQFLALRCDQDIPQLAANRAQQWPDQRHVCLFLMGDKSARRADPPDANADKNFIAREKT